MVITQRPIKYLSDTSVDHTCYFVRNECLLSLVVNGRTEPVPRPAWERSEWYLYRLVPISSIHQTINDLSNYKTTLRYTAHNKFLGNVPYILSKMQLDVGSEPYLSTAQALCLLISNIFYFKSLHLKIL